MVGQDREMVVMQSIKSIEDAWKEMDIKVEPTDEEVAPAHEIEQSVTQVLEPASYVTRSDRISRPPKDLLKYAVVNETYIQNYQDIGNDEVQDTIKCTYAMKALLFQKALKLKPKEAMKH
jgi:hypothetical protein